MIHDYNAIDWASILYYDESSPTGLRWLNDVSSGCCSTRVLVRANSVAGRRSVNGYSSTRFKGKEYRNHRIIWILHNGQIDQEKVIDHIDGDITNNKISNLRLVTRKINSRNLGSRKNNSTGVVGVYYNQLNNSFVANWFDKDGNRKAKWFSCNKYGDSAFILACEYRASMLKELNQQGAGYSDRHIEISSL